jgi:hypothetical protein
VARRRGPVEDIKRADLEVSAFKGIEDFPGDGVAGKGVCYVWTELRLGGMGDRCGLGRGGVCGDIGFARAEIVVWLAFKGLKCEFRSG